MKTKNITYIAPLLEIIEENRCSILSGSIDSNKNINYGGKDENGEMEPSSLDIEFDE